MGTWALFSTEYCATKSSCVLVDAWLQLFLTVVSFAFLLLLCFGICWYQRRQRTASAAWEQAPVGAEGRWGLRRRILDMLLALLGHRRTAPLPLAVIQKDATAANITSHKNSTKHAVEFIQQTQRMSRLDLATQRRHSHEATARSNSASNILARMGSFTLRKPSSDRLLATVDSTTSPQGSSMKVLPVPGPPQRKLSSPLPQSGTRRASLLASTADNDDANEISQPVRRASAGSDRNTSFRQRIATVLYPNFIKSKHRQRSATTFDVPSYKKKQQLAALSPEHRTKKERRASVELRDKRRLSIGANSLLQFEVGDGDHAAVYEVKLKEIHLVKRLAFGPLSEVYAAIWRDTKVGVKLLMPREGVVDRLEDAVKNFRREIWVMNALRHPNIVKLIGACLTPSCYVLVMEYMSNGSLYDYLRDENNFFPHQMILTSALDIAEGMQHIHECGVLQRDLKSKNCLVSENLVVKVADFGLARFRSKDYGEYTFVGTPFWAAPEVIRHEAYDEKADVYSFAIVLWELVERRDPYEDVNAFQVPLMVANDGLRPRDFTKSAPLGLEQLMKQCWDANPDQRPTFEEIADTLHKWIFPDTNDPRPVSPTPDAEDDLSEHVKREQTTANAHELHRFASSHNANAKVIPIVLSRGHTERHVARRLTTLLVKTNSDRSDGSKHSVP